MNQCHGNIKLHFNKEIIILLPNKTYSRPREKHSRIYETSGDRENVSDPLPDSARTCMFSQPHRACSSSQIMHALTAGSYML